MANYANQKTIKINRTTPKVGDGNRFLQIYETSICEASKNLTPNGFKLYLYLATNKDGYNADYSPQAFANKYGVGIDSARRITQNLIDNGYLIHLGGNKYEFYETPQKKKEVKISINEETRFIEQTDGTFIQMTYTEVYNELKNDYPAEIIAEVWETAKKEVG